MLASYDPASAASWSCAVAEVVRDSAEAPRLLPASHPELKEAPAPRPPPATSCRSKLISARSVFSTDDSPIIAATNVL